MRQGKIEPDADIAGVEMRGGSIGLVEAVLALGSTALRALESADAGGRCRRQLRVAEEGDAVGAQRDTWSMVAATLSLVWCGKP